MNQKVKVNLGQERIFLTVRQIYTMLRNIVLDDAKTYEYVSTGGTIKTCNIIGCRVAQTFPRIHIGLLTAMYGQTSVQNIGNGFCKVDYYMIELNDTFQCRLLSRFW